MQIVFPENIVVMEWGSIMKAIQTSKGATKFIPIDISKPEENLITLNKVDYVFTGLSIDSVGNKGGNSIILRLYKADDIDFDEPQYDYPDMVLKIMKTPKAFKVEYEKKSEKRFKREIEALIKCKDLNFQNVIELFDYGICKIRSSRQDTVNEYLCYTMEHAQYDLKSYIEANHSTLIIENKISLCLSLASGLNELRSLGYYHRDIKPDNIFMVKNNWKIGDLGLMAERDSIEDIDSIAERLGPKGWMSPEAMSKYLCEGKGFSFRHNCKIDHQSDIFMLGKVFWYIFQHNAPIGSIKENDFQVKLSRIYPIIRTMLNYSKSSRYSSIEEVIRLLKPIEASSLQAVY